MKSNNGQRSSVSMETHVFLIYMAPLMLTAMELSKKVEICCHGNACCRCGYIFALRQLAPVEYQFDLYN